MKNSFSLKTAGLALVAGLAMASCNEAPKGDKATITDEKSAATASGQKFVVDTEASLVEFTGNGVGKNHPGSFKLTSGSVAVANNQITGGEFLIDIKSMDMEEEGDMIDNKLRPHLLSGDFFDAEKFGTAKFEITKVEPYQNAGNDTSIVQGANFNVSGNFTLKGVTKNISFPARIELDDNTMEAEANFDIDRRQWQMNYGNDKTLGDKFISETVNIELDLIAKRPADASASVQ
ncbi:YceI family protein [Rufibacter immobilis]|uniref:YceI family protein n=1 Tax=Rufibacter immobilis TaxID=1348778 RepID=UPI0035E6484F